MNSCNCTLPYTNPNACKNCRVNGNNKHDIIAETDFYANGKHYLQTLCRKCGKVVEPIEIEKLKCCGNCKYFEHDLYTRWCLLKNDITKHSSKCDKWEVMH